MKDSELHLLRQLARFYGIQTSYRDVFGKRQEASTETLRALLICLGVSNFQIPREALRSARQQEIQTVLAPVIVLWDGRSTTVPLRVPSHWPPRSVACQLVLEDGPVVACPIWANKIRVPKLPLGYHSLDLLTPQGKHSSLIISAPLHSYEEPGTRKNWGLFLPMYACHSQQSWGAGNLSDWMRFTDWAASLGAKVVGTLPLLPAFLDKPFEPSPYSPISRLFWNEFYLDVPLLPEFSLCPAAQKLVQSSAIQAEIKKLRKNPLVDYQAEMALKRKILQPLAEFFFTTEITGRGVFERFVSARPEALHYAEFRATCEQTRTTWQTWPQRLRDGDLRESDFAQARKKYHLYAQWSMQRQMDEVIQRCCSLKVDFHLDFPLGVNPAGYDGWRNRDLFANKASVGAPPDAFFTKGQNWGFAPLHPQRSRANRYAYLLQVLRFQMRHTGMLRIDHVMGLHRLYWIPKGMSASEGAYVSYPAEELHALLCLESHRNQTVLVGENLGTVPPEVNRSMDRHGFRKMFVLQYEFRPKASRPLPPPPRATVASLNTHDMPTFAAFWEGLDIKQREGFLKSVRPKQEEILEAALAFLGRSQAETVLINLEDLWQERCPQNVPGTSCERPNWRRKTRFCLEEISDNPRIRKLLQRFASLRKLRQAKSPKKI